jgi:uncharacterized protein (TIGR02001 family)
VAALGAAAVPFAACAQTSLAVTALSDFRVRGLSYSAEKPVLQLSANHDFASGWYAGGLASTAQAHPSRLDGIGSLYLGFARGTGGLHWDAGVVRHAYKGARQYSYHEWYAGVGVERASARLSWSPAYLGTGGRTAYLELNGNWPLGEHLEASAHLGYLKAFDRMPGWYAVRIDRPDWRVGLHAFSGEWSFQLAWSGTRAEAGVFPGWRHGATRGLVLGATRHF